ncbi:gastrula zinc finger protein XlCGF26.1 isoform X2 [Athalia rosae]|uniref:gastrula zinc finger protein XlCGF26.1 isoform X2 n=1 Tax=Athalia rosae TaxID=37344 RepID=UPI0020338C3E|nr:gastrula zinc finger protein XlCGF26.1 isoform X2 [Athalia rosae]
MSQEIVKIEHPETTKQENVQEEVELIFGDSPNENDVQAAVTQGELVFTAQTIGHNTQIIQIVTDYECVTCRRIFTSENLLKDHLEVCRDEDDRSDTLEIGQIAYNSDDEGVDDPLHDNQDGKNEVRGSKNNNGKTAINPVDTGKCHCCAEDLATAHTRGRFKCSKCDFYFKKASSLERHDIVIHWGGETLLCKVCGVPCNNKRSLDKHHYTYHAQQQVHKCERCDKYFSRKYHLDRHVMQTGCDGVSRANYICQVCNKVFTRKDNLREHLRMHAGAPQRQKKAACSYCSKEFYTNQQLVIHERIHTGERPISCDLCSKTFLSTPAMKKHRRVHTGEKPFKCKFCDKKFAARETLNRHHRTHTGDKPHVCQYCGKTFIQAVQLRAHVFHHTGENAFYCDECGKAFNRKTRLTVHMKFVHQGAVPFQCKVCEKSFIRKEDLSRHSVLHTGIKPHQCEKCSKSFAVKSALRVHMNTHRREVPQSCDECGRAFIRQDCLMRHMRTKHRDMLEDAMAEAEKRHLQKQLFKIATTAATKSTEGAPVTILSQDKLLKAIVELLTLLVEEETLQAFGWPQAPIQDVLEAVIRRCGHLPLSSDSDLLFAQRLRENVKILFTVVIEDDTVKSLLTTQTVDEVILHVLKLSKDK